MINKVENSPNGQGVDLGRRSILISGLTAGGLVLAGAGGMKLVEAVAAGQSVTREPDELRSEIALLGREVQEWQFKDSPLHIRDATGSFNPQGILDLYNHIPTNSLISGGPVFYEVSEGKNINIKVMPRGGIKRHDLLITEVYDRKPIWAKGYDRYSMTLGKGRFLSYIKNSENIQNKNDRVQLIQGLATEFLLVKNDFTVMENNTDVSEAEVGELYSSSLGMAFALRLEGLSYEDYITVISGVRLTFPDGRDFMYYKMEKSTFDKLPQKISLFRTKAGL